MTNTVVAEPVVGSRTFGAAENPASGSDARALALGVLHHAEACWRGDERAHRFAARLGAYWRPQLPHPPETVPHAFSPHGAGGHGIAWYQTDGEVLGYIPGCKAGYQVPREAVSSLVRCA
jgi:hypothetical protein